MVRRGGGYIKVEEKLVNTQHYVDAKNLLFIKFLKIEDDRWV